MFHGGFSLRFQDQIDNEWSEIESVFKAVIGLVLVARSKVFQPLKERRQNVEREAKGLTDGLQAEISRLEKTISELDNISELEDHIFFLQVGGVFVVMEPLRSDKRNHGYVDIYALLDFGWGTIHKWVLKTV